MQTLFHEIVIPYAVVQELQTGIALGKDVPNISKYPWIKQISVNVPTILRDLVDLDAGETQVLALALENPDALVILDDQLARQTAVMSDLKLIGTVGILLLAKSQHLIPEIAPLLDMLQHFGFHLHDQTKVHALRLAGE